MNGIAENHSAVSAANMVFTHGRFAITFHVSQRWLLLISCLAILSHSPATWVDQVLFTWADEVGERLKVKRYSLCSLVRLRLLEREKQFDANRVSCERLPSIARPRMDHLGLRRERVNVERGRAYSRELQPSSFLFHQHAIPESAAAAEFFRSCRLLSLWMRQGELVGCDCSRKIHQELVLRLVLVRGEVCRRRGAVRAVPDRR